MTTFNLWREPWLTVIDCAGRSGRISFHEALRYAHQWAAIEAINPVEEVGLMRQLTALAQAIFQPTSIAAWRALWDAGQFDSAPIARFGEQYAARFDLFSSEPWLQSGDLPLTKGRDVTKPIAYLDFTLPTGVNSNLFDKRREWSHAFCPACCAAGLAAIPPWATAGGATYTKSINGGTPYYVQPVGRTLFQTLAASLLTPEFWPTSADPDDRPWWTRPAQVERGQSVGPIGYLASLTFPARRVRLYPELSGTCTRCGQSGLLVRDMTFQGGERYSPDAPAWRDPFMAYVLNKDGKPERPVYPVEHPRQPPWLTAAQIVLGSERLRQPAIIEQWNTAGCSDMSMRWRVVGLATKQAKYLEWYVVGEEWPRDLFTTDRRAVVSQALDYAAALAAELRRQLRRKATIARLSTDLSEITKSAYWADLAATFRVWASDSTQTLAAWQAICHATATRQVMRHVPSAVVCADVQAALERCSNRITKLPT